MQSVTKIKIRGYHIDHFGIVNHARYLEFMEEARWQYMEDNNLADGAIHSLGIIHVVVNINIDYRKPAVLGDELRITTSVTRRSSKSFTIAQKMVKGDGELLVAEAEVTNVFIDGKTNKVQPIEGDILTTWPDLSAAG